MNAHGSFSFSDPIGGTVPDGYLGVCPNSKWQRDYVEDFVKTWAAYGVDCWYFDTLPFGYGFSPVCYNTGHGHAQSAEHVARHSRNNPPARSGRWTTARAVAMPNECISDIVAIYGLARWATELQGWCQPPKPEIWRYTFPEYLVFTGHCNGLCLSAYPGYDNLDSRKRASRTTCTRCATPRTRLQPRVPAQAIALDLLNTFIWHEGRMNRPP